jgi:hypothetical protein
MKRLERNTWHDDNPWSFFLTVSRVNHFVGVSGQDRLVMLIQALGVTARHHPIFVTAFLLGVSKRGIGDRVCVC